MAEEMMNRQNRRLANAGIDGELSDDSLEFVIGGLDRVWTNPNAPLVPGTLIHDGLRPPTPGTQLLS
jgi:hypothetical protein